MVERDRDTKAVSRCKAHSFTDYIPVIHHRMMAENDTFWKTGGTAGILDIDGIVELERLLPLNNLVTAYFFPFPDTVLPHKHPVVRNITYENNVFQERELIAFD